MSDKKSFIAKIEEGILRHNKLKFMDSIESLDEFLNGKCDTPSKPVKSIFKSIDVDGMQVFTFGDENAKNTILYAWRSICHGNKLSASHILLFAVTKSGCTCHSTGLSAHSFA